MINSTWLIIDEKPGNANQAIALAKAMGISYDIKHLQYSFFSFLPNWLKFNRLLGINSFSKKTLEAPYPDLIISSGRKTAAVSSYIKKHSPQSFNIHIMNPDMAFENFDLICLPLHDKSKNYEKHSNIIYSIGALSYFDQNRKLEPIAEIEKLSHPFISFILGGTTKNGDYNLAELKWLTHRANKLAKSINGTLLITTSRRTPVDVAMNLKKEITVPHYFYDWHKMQNITNPYPTFLKISDYFITTGDSVSTCSEILATGKSLYVYRKDKILYPKHKRFLDYLNNLGYIKYINDDVPMLEKWDYPLLNEAKRIGQFIKEKIQGC